ncbi:MAG: hypothetical protein FWG67_08830 [Defluviitaleaceae bacterium]|nr:hypothetical protein [Defluviitaleaceae bacterium]
MKANFLSFTYQKAKHQYRLIAVSVFVSIIILNALFQTMFISFRTLQDQMLHHTNLSLILMQSYDENHFPYLLNLDDIIEIDHVQFVSMSTPLMLVGIDDDGNMEGFITRAVNPNYAHFVGIDYLKDGTIYCSSMDYADIGHYQIMDINAPISLVTYDGQQPLVVAGSCFVSESTYEKLYLELPYGYTEFVMPEYLIGVDNVRHVFDVARQLDTLSYDSMILFQASGLESLIEDVYVLLIILFVVFLIITIFNIFIVFFLSSSLVKAMSRDLMILYLNGMSRNEVAKQLNSYISKFFNVSIISSSILSFIMFIIALQFILRQALSIEWLLLVLLINLGVVMFNTFMIRIIISKLVKDNTSNENISKIVRN